LTKEIFYSSKRVPKEIAKNSQNEIDLAEKLKKQYFDEK